MPSTYTVNLGIELPATGEQSGLWGDTVNDNSNIIDEAINGVVVITLSSAGSSGSPNTIAITNGTTSTGRNKYIEFADGGDLGAAAYVALTPNDAEKICLVRNSLSGSRSIFVFQGTYSTSNDLEILAGTDVLVKFNGGGTGATVVNVYDNLAVNGIDVAGLVEFNSLSGTGSVAVTDILDQDNMSGNSATALATQQSIKAYVDSQVGTVDTLAEILANGNTTGSTDIDVDAAQKVQFRDAAIYINSSVDGQLDIVADTEIQIAATTIDINGAINASGEIIAASLDISGNVDVDGITNLDIVDIDGAVDMATTLAVAGNVDFNGDLDVDGITNLDVVDIDGAVDMATTLAVAGNVDFNGDLDVDGTTNLDVVDIDGAVDMATTLAVAGNVDFNGDLDVDGTTNLDVVDIDGAVNIAAATTIDAANKVQFRDTAIYINSSVDGQLDIVADTEIQLAATTIDINGAINASGEIIASSLDISGNIDVDGTANLDIVDIDGAVDMATTLTVAGNVDFNGDLDVDGTTNLDAVDIDGAVQIDGTVSVGVNDTGYDVKFFGATSGKYAMWDESADSLLVAGTLDVDGLVEFNSLSGTGSVAVTDILDEDSFSSNSATALITQQSTKAYIASSSVSKTANTGAANIPTGSTGQRPTAATGQFRFNTTDTTFEGYNGSEWGPLAGGGEFSKLTYEYIATAGQTTFSGSDLNGQTLSYTAGNTLVTYGGLDLAFSDFTATNGTSVVLADGAIVGKIVRIIAFTAFAVANTYTKAQIDAKDAVVGVQGGVFYENPTTIAANYTITTNKNAMTAGPITVNSGVTVTVPANSTWTIV
tara:strand:+ start:3233 stop:5707 length:2475 start_codon:yes stop_codon:yes gene_type:complete